MKKILVVNCGSSSLKYSVYEMPEQKLICAGIFESLDSDKTAIYTYKLPDEEGKMKKVYDDVEMHQKTTHHEAILKMTELLLDSKTGVIKDLSEISAVGHRVVHGGEVFTESVLIDDNVVSGIRNLIPLAPLHNPAHITGIELCREVFGKELPQVAVFDNAFHSTMPATSYMYALPYKFYENDKIRKYGFHGTSHRYVANRVADIMNKPLEEIKLITCHLGNGCSITAIKDGKVLDTSMGFTPLDGFMMGTRCGAIDPSIVTYLMEHYENLAPKEIDNIMNKQSGVIGISGIGSDDRVVAEAADNGNERAKLARDMQWYQIRKYIGSYIAAMNGVDAIAFMGGIGENCPELREDVINNLSYLGISLDKTENNQRGKEIEISTKNSNVKAFVIPTNEELMIACDTFNLI